MFERAGHPLTAELLAITDGELGQIAAWRIRRHIARCWVCRGRLLELQNTIADVSRNIAGARSDTDSKAVARARWNFRRMVTEFEAEHRPDSPRRMRFAAAFAGVTVLLVGLFGYQQFRPVPGTASAVKQSATAAELLARAEAHETATASAVREESFAVEITSSRNNLTTSRQLRVLSAPRAGLHSARWLDAGGVLRNAVFAAEAEDDAVYSRLGGLRPAHLARTSHRQPLYRGVAEAGADLDDMEASVIAWMEKQVWEPVSLAREAVEFSSHSGATLQITRDGGDLVWVAEAIVKGATMRLTLRGTEQKPLALMHIAWESAKGSGSVRFRREQRKDYADLASAPVWLRASALRRPAESAPLPPLEASVVGPSQPELAGAEVEVLAALHRSGLCQQDGIRVIGGPASVLVAGTFASEAERERIQALIQSIPRASLIESDLRLIDSSQWPEAVPLQHIEQPTRAAPAEPWLRARMAVGTRASERDMFNRMNSLVSSAQEVLADAWALRRLAGYIPASRQDLLRPEDRDVLLAIVSDHARSMTSKLTQIDAELGFTTRTDSSLASNFGTAWQEQVPALRKAAEQFCEAMLRFFASSDATALTANTNPEISELPGLLHRLKTSTPALAEAAAIHTVSK